MRITAEQYRDLQDGKLKIEDIEKPESTKPPAKPRKGMNGLERRWAQRLDALKRAGEIQEWRYQPITLLLGEDCRYTPDFLITNLDGSLALHETKGYMQEDARVKLHTAATLFPEFTFVKITEHAGRWVETLIERRHR